MGKRTLTRLRDHLDAVYRSPGGKRTLKWGQHVLTAIIIAVLAYQLTHLGWRDVLAALPVSPFFYLLLVSSFFVLPLVEVMIYRRLWPVSRRDAFWALLKKRVFNYEVLGYSGEAYLFLWARNRVGLRDSVVARHIRDVNILSAIGSLLFSAGVVAFLFTTGLLDMFEWVTKNRWLYAAAGLLVVGGLVGLFLMMRNHFFAMPPRTAVRVFSLHVSQVLVVHVMMVAQWMVGAPGIPTAVWLAFAGITILMNRIPFLPNKDLIFIGLSVELSRALELAAASVAGMLLVSSVGMKLMNVLVLAAVQYLVKDPALQTTLEEAEEALPDLALEDETPRDAISGLGRQDENR
jgi:hypothetical protein